MRLPVTILMLLVMALSFVALVGCSHEDIDFAQATNTRIIEATTQPTARYFESAPIIGEYVKFGLGFAARVLKLVNPFLDFLRPPVPREAVSMLWLRYV